MSKNKENIQVEIPIFFTQDEYATILYAAAASNRTTAQVVVAAITEYITSRNASLSA